MKKGGYQILSFSNVLPFTVGETKVIPGIGECLKMSGQKRTVISGLVIDSQAYPDFEVLLLQEDSGDFTGKLNGYDIEIIVETDTVTISEQPEGGIENEDIANL